MNREFKSASSGDMYGEIKTFLEPKGDDYDFIQGVYMGDGRKVGEGQNESETIIIIDEDSKSDPVKLLFKHSVLKNELQKVLEQRKKDKREKELLFLSIAYKGKRLAKSGSKYHDYFIKYDYANDLEASAARQILNEAKGE